MYNSYILQIFECYCSLYLYIKYEVMFLREFVRSFSPQPLNGFDWNLEYNFYIYNAKKLLKKIFKKLHRKKVTAWQPISYQYIKITLCIRQNKLLSVLNKKITLCIRQKSYFLYSTVSIPLSIFVLLYDECTVSGVNTPSYLIAYKQQ